MTFDHYEEVPKNITEEIINNAKELSGFTNAVLEVKDFEDKFND
jgi:hypothetical protein